MVVHEIVCPGDCEQYVLDHPDTLSLFSAPGDRLELLLRSNEPPLPSEESLLRRQVAAAEDAFVKYDRRLTCLESELRRIRGRRDGLHEFIGSRKAVISPIRRLPSELIAEIVHHIIESDDVAGTHVTLQVDVRKGPWPLGQICRHWRNVVVSLPDLWSRLQISAQDICSASPQILDTILHRSQDRPLQLSLDLTSAIDANTNLHKAVLKKLVLHSYHWRIAQFKALTMDFLPEFDAVKDRLPLLEEITLLCKSQFDGNPFASVDCFANAPKLRSARVIFPGQIRLLQLPWSQLVTLSLSGCIPGGELNILRQLSHSIEDLDFSPGVGFGDVPDDHEVIELSSLKRLSAYDWEWFRDIRSPALHYVGIAAVLAHIQLLTSIVLRSSCHLTTLSLSSVYDSDVEDGLVSLWRGSPTISTLLIRDSVYLPTVLQRLAWSPDSQDNILPQLQRLSIECDCDDDLLFWPMLESVVDVVESRQVQQTMGGTTVARLDALNFETLKNDVHDNIIPADIEDWQAEFDVFRAQGINIFLDLDSDLNSSESDILDRLSLVS